MNIYHPFMPIRNIVRRGSHRVVGQFVSRKMKRGLFWESFLERDFIFLLEFSRFIIAYFAQPFRERYCLNGKLHTYVPDFLVFCIHEKFKIHEIKPEEEANNPDKVRKFSIMNQKYGDDFTVTTENEIRLEPRLDNVKLLFRYLHENVSVRELLTVLSILRAVNRVSIEDLMSGKHGNVIGKPTIYALIAQGYLEIDIFDQVTDESLIWLHHPPDVIDSTEVFCGNDQSYNI